MRYWLMKSEPDEFSLEDLWNAPGRKTHWDGVRNYQARNFMRDDMKPGDLVFYYHSNTDIPGIVGLAEVCSGSYPDHTAFDPNDKHFDAKSDPENPRWMMVDIRYKRKLKKKISLAEIKAHADRLEDFALIRRGNRLSVMPVDKKHFTFVLGLESTPQEPT